MEGKLVRLFLVEGVPTGLKTIELSNMTILETIFPRTKINKFLERDEANKPGVYILVGNSIENADEFIVYVGEGDPVSPRLKSHSNKKDFWTEAIVFTSKDNYLTKTQIQYLEAELVAMLNESGKVKLDNTQMPTKPNISEVDKSEVTQFLNTIKLLLSSVGISILESSSIEIVKDSTTEMTKNTKEFVLTNKNAKAKMVLDNDNYIVLKGSTAVMKNRGSCPEAISKLKNKLIKDKVLEEHGEELYIFTTNYVFKSPSYAGAMISGGSVNGQKAWKYNGVPLSDINNY